MLHLIKKNWRRDPWRWSSLCGQAFEWETTKNAPGAEEATCVVCLLRYIEAQDDQIAQILDAKARAERKLEEVVEEARNAV